MLRHALRRLFWLVPVLIGVTLASFVLVSYTPIPETELAATGEDAIYELGRSQFRDLPRFFNKRPRDVQRRVNEELARVSAGDAEARRAIATLARLGGAALPILLPRLDSLDPSSRQRVALGLAGVAERMGIHAREASDPERAVAFWNRYWTDRAIDFRQANARRAVRRLLVHGTATREADVVELDTFALEAIVSALTDLVPPLRTAPSSADVDAVRRLVEASSHMTDHTDELPREAGPAEALACVQRWQAFWLVHASDYTSESGAGLLFAMLTDTQYAKWAQRALFIGSDQGGAPALTALGQRARTTLSIVFVAMGLAYLAAVVIPIACAARGGQRGAWIAFLWIGASAVPVACWTALWPATVARTVAAVASLACALLASPLAQQRAALERLLAEDHVRLAAAYGMGPLRIALRRALRGSLLPIIALSSADLPVAIGGSFVVETAFGIHGLGEQTLRAVQTHDVAWLVGLAFTTALVLTLASIAGDLAISLLDPRLSLAAIRRRRGSP
jgi:peptide/nickel transport system permease protein